MATFKLNKNQKLILGILGVVILVIGIYYIFIRPKKNIEGINLGPPQLAEVSTHIKEGLLKIAAILGTDSPALNILLNFFINLSSGSGNIGLNILDKIKLLKTDGIFLGLFTIRNQKQNKELADEISKELLFKGDVGTRAPLMFFTELPELCIIDTDQLAEGVEFNNGIELPLLPQNNIVNLINSNPFIQINNIDSFIVNDECIQYTVISNDKDLGMAFDKFYENIYNFVPGSGYRIPDPKNISNECEEWYPDKQPILGIKILPYLKEAFKKYYGNSYPNFNWNNVVANSYVLQDLITCRGMALMHFDMSQDYLVPKAEASVPVKNVKKKNQKVPVNPAPVKKEDQEVLDSLALLMNADPELGKTIENMDVSAKDNDNPEIVSFVPTFGFLLLKPGNLYIKLELGGEIKEQIKYSHIAEFLDENINEPDNEKLVFNFFSLLNNLLIDANKQKDKFLFNLISPLLLFETATTGSRSGGSEIERIKNMLGPATATTHVIPSGDGVIKLKVNTRVPGPWLLVTNLLPINSKNKITSYKLSFSRDDKTYGPISKLFTDPTEKQITEEVIKGVNSISDENKKLIIQTINSKNNEIAGHLSNIGDTTQEILDGQTTIKNGIKQIELNIGSIGTDIGEIKGEITAIGTDIEAIKDDITAIGTDIGEIKGGITSIEEGQQEILDKIGEESTNQLKAYNDKINKLSKKLEELITDGLKNTDAEIKEQINNSEETLKAELRQLQNDKDLLLAEIKSSNNLSDGEVRNIDINIENRTRGGGRGGGGYMPQQPLVITQPSAPVIQQPIVAPQPVRVYDREKKDDSGVSMANVMLYALPSIAIVGIIYIMMNRMNKKK